MSLTPEEQALYEKAGRICARARKYGAAFDQAGCVEPCGLKAC